MASIAPATHMTLEQLRATSEYLSLTRKQKSFLELYLKTSDANAAIREVYGAKDDAYISMFANKTLSSPRIKACLDLMEQRSPRERFLLTLQENIRKSKGVAKAEFCRLYAQATGLIPNTSSSGDIEADPRVPADALETWVDERGVVVGYRNASGVDVKF